MNDLPSPVPPPSQSILRVDQLVFFDAIAVTDPEELNALYVPLPKVFVILVGKATGEVAAPASPELPDSDRAAS